MLSLKIIALSQFVLFKNLSYATWADNDFDIIILGYATKINPFKPKRNMRVKWSLLENTSKMSKFSILFSVVPFFLLCTRIYFTKSNMKLLDKDLSKPIQEFIERPTTKDGWKWQIASVLPNNDWKMWRCLRYEKSRGRLYLLKVHQCYCWSCANVSNGRRGANISFRTFSYMSFWNVEIDSWTVCVCPVERITVREFTVHVYFINVMDPLRRYVLSTRQFMVKTLLCLNYFLICKINIR